MTKLPPTEGLRAATAKAAAWSAGSRVVSQVAQFVGLVVLARILPPSDFGLVAIVVVFGNFASLFADLGIGAAVVHSRSLTTRFLSSAFWMNWIAGLGIFLVLVCIAPLVAKVYGDPRLTGLVVTSGLIYVVTLTVVPLAILERQLRLRAVGLVEVAAAIGAQVVGIVAALNAAGPYALILMQLSQAASLSLGYLVVSRFRPRGRPSVSAIKEIWSYSGGIVGSNVANFASRNSDTLILGYSASAAAVGFYSRAFQLMLLPVSQIQLVIGRVLFPALTRLRDDLPRMRRAHREALLRSVAISSPIAAGLAACSSDFVLALFGPAWIPMIPLLAILASTGVQQVIQGTAGVLYQSLGLTRLMLKVNVIFALITVGAFVVGAQWGALGLAVAVAMRGWLLLPVTLFFPLRALGDSVRGVLGHLGPVLVAVLIEVAVILMLWTLLTGRVDSPVARLAVEVLGGGLSYSVAVLLLSPGIRRDIGKAGVALIGARLHRRS